ncbi:MAG: 50S ribosomal protein L10 [Desulfobaccales bacterium]
MKLTREQKKEQSKGLSEVLKGSAHLYFTGYQGLKFKDIAELRAQLKPIKCGYRVVKNSILHHALKQAGVAIESTTLLDGPNALLWAQQDDPVSPARVLVKFAKTHQALKLKAGFVGGCWMTAVDCQKLSTLGTRPELLTQLAGALYSTLAQGAWVLAAPIRDFVLVLKAVQEKKGAEAKA